MGGRSAPGWFVCRGTPYFHCLVVFGMGRSRREGSAGLSGTIECCSPPTPHFSVYPSTPNRYTSLLPGPLGDPLLRRVALLAVNVMCSIALVKKKTSSATLPTSSFLFVCLFLVYLFCFALFAPLWSARFRLVGTFKTIDPGTPTS